mmetsp:Transcript_25416/g.72395  ORF Transcript_25416/g.72395 Transcript_25416/m.72395 type:complete len:337 (-) Transcript_25416:313-1323(-)
MASPMVEASWRDQGVALFGGQPHWSRSSSTQPLSAPIMVSVAESVATRAAATSLMEATPSASRFSSRTTAAATASRSLLSEASSARTCSRHPLRGSCRGLAAGACAGAAASGHASARSSILLCRCRRSISARRQLRILSLPTQLAAASRASAASVGAALALAVVLAPLTLVLAALAPVSTGALQAAAGSEGSFRHAGPSRRSCCGEPSRAPPARSLARAAVSLAPAPWWQGSEPAAAAACSGASCGQVRSWSHGPGATGPGGRMSSQASLPSAAPEAWRTCPAAALESCCSGPAGSAAARGGIAVPSTAGCCRGRLCCSCSSLSVRVKSPAAQELL